ncbi:MAG: hypothetical protein R3F11_16800 [Verrucomicrobiales bacterium]
MESPAASGPSSLLIGHLERVLFHETTILARLDELGRQITADYAGKNLTVIAILHGGIMFMQTCCAAFTCRSRWRVSR